MKKINKILIIIQRSNGDVFLSLSLINLLYANFKNPKIDLLVNDDTSAIAKLFPNINFIHEFSYKKKYQNGFNQERKLITNIFRKYDLSINLTSSDRSVLYCILSSNNSISAIENINKKSWWKKILLKHYYYYDSNKHVLLNNLKPLSLLKIKHKLIQDSPIASHEANQSVNKLLNKYNIKNFVIFHPSAQYEYKIFPEHLRNKLLGLLSTLGIPIIVTGSNNLIDSKIKKEIPVLKNIYNFIGKTSIEEYLSLSQLSSAYIGMDTLNMHIASSQNKRIFAIFGPTNLKMWSPWSNTIQKASQQNKLCQTYENITIFQGALPCVACGKAGCDNQKGRSECLYIIDPKSIFNEVSNWCKDEQF